MNEYEREEVLFMGNFKLFYFLITQLMSAMSSFYGWIYSSIHKLLALDYDMMILLKFNKIILTVIFKFYR